VSSIVTKMLCCTTACEDVRSNVEDADVLW
jgi:hypothetical protein